MSASTTTSGSNRGRNANLQRLRSDTGGFALLALDQREALRGMLPVSADDSAASDAELVAYKESALAILSPHVPGVLLDLDFGVPGGQRPSVLAPRCNIILAADSLHSAPGQGASATTFDDRITPSLVRQVGAVAVKILVIWRSTRAERDAGRTLVDRFLELADATDMAAFVEGIVRPAEGTEWRSHEERCDAILTAAQDLSPGADVYKAEAPGYLPGDLSRVTDQSHQISNAIAVPWVVLSNGVRADEFAEVVRLTCAAGGSGFLAGRAIWADTTGESDPTPSLRERSVPRLERLREIVEESRMHTQGSR